MTRPVLSVLKFLICFILERERNQPSNILLDWFCNIELKSFSVKHVQIKKEIHVLQYAFIIINSSFFQGYVTFRYSYYMHILKNAIQRTYNSCTIVK